MAEPVAEADVPMVIPVGKPRSRRRRLIVYTLLGLIVAGGFFFWFAPPALRKWRLAKDCQDADRVVLVLNVPPKRVQGGWTG